MLCSLPPSWVEKEILPGFVVHQLLLCTGLLFSMGIAESETKLFHFFTFTCETQICGLSEVFSPACTVTGELQGSG